MQTPCIPGAFASPPAAAAPRAQEAARRAVPAPCAAVDHSSLPAASPAPARQWVDQDFEEYFFE